MSAARADPPSVNLSKLAKLEALVFDCGIQDVQWITATLQTVESKNLRQITIRSHADIEDPVSETVLREGQDLDRLLSPLRILRSVEITRKKRREERDLEGLARMLLPELTGRGAVDFVEPRRTSFSSCSPLACLD